MNEVKANWLVLTCIIMRFRSIKTHHVLYVPLLRQYEQPEACRWGEGVSYHAHSELMAQLVRRHVASGIQGNSADISTQYYKIKALKYRDIRNT